MDTKGQAASNSQFIGRKEQYMNRKTTLDIAIFISCLTGMILSYVYLDNYTEKEISLLIPGITGAFFLILAVKDKNKTDKPERS